MTKKMQLRDLPRHVASARSQTEDLEGEQVSILGGTYTGHIPKPQKSYNDSAPPRGKP